MRGEEGGRSVEAIDGEGGKGKGEGVVDVLIDGEPDISSWLWYIGARNRALGFWEETAEQRNRGTRTWYTSSSTFVRNASSPFGAAEGGM